MAAACPPPCCLDGASAVMRSRILPRLLAATARMSGGTSGPDDILTVVGEAGQAMIRSFDGGNSQP